MLFGTILNFFRGNTEGPLDSKCNDPQKQLAAAQLCICGVSPFSGARQGQGFKFCCSEQTVLGAIRRALEKV